MEHLLTPNWQSRLPGYGYDGEDPDGYRTMPEVIDFFDKYSQLISAPVYTSTKVTSLSANCDGFLVATDKGEWNSRTVVLATGACNIPSIPKVAEAIPSVITTLAPMHYRNPDQLEDGSVLVVGAAATGTQLAEEIHRSGRPVILSVGEYVRAPRIYRGKDIQWWMDKAGVLDERYDEVDDIVRARKVPSIQVVGTPERTTLDLNALTSIGIKIRGPLAAIRDKEVLFSGSLRNQYALADLKMNRLLGTIDTWANENDLEADVELSHRFTLTEVEDSPPLGLDLAKENIKTVLLATGYRPDYSWLDLPVFDRKGQIFHDGGVIADSPEAYVTGLLFLRRRKSALIDGAADDSNDIADHFGDFSRR